MILKITTISIFLQVFVSTVLFFIFSQEGGEFGLHQVIIVAKFFKYAKKTACLNPEKQAVFSKRGQRLLSFK